MWPCQTLSCVSQVYVFENNIFLRSDVSAEVVQVTTNGKRNEILNGLPDWVYEGKPDWTSVGSQPSTW